MNVKPATSRPVKIVLPLLGIVLALLALESALRLGGWIFLTIQHSNIAFSDHATDYKILCLGESTTAGSVHSTVSCWPGELELNLNDLHLSHSFVVINEGVPGTNLVEILSRLGELLERYQPDLVIAMVGINDGAIGQTEDTFRRRMSARLERFRVVKLLTLIYRHVHARAGAGPSPASVHGPTEDYEWDKPPQLADREAVMKFYAGQIEVHPEESRWYFAFAHYLSVYHDQTSLNEPRDPALLLKAGDLFLAALEKGPSELEGKKIIGVFQAYRQDLSAEEQAALMEKFERSLAQSRPRNEYAALALASWLIDNQRFKDAAPVLETAIRMNPANEDPYLTLGRIYAQRLGDVQRAEIQFRKAQEIRLHYYKPDLQDYYAKLAQQVEKSRCKLVLLQYPQREVAEIERYLPANSGVLFVSNKENFAIALLTSSYEDLFIDRFAGDFGHCTKMGNKVIADHVAQVLVEYMHWQ